ncbi:hypothetical protein GEMRC1_001700 [Eukaryota sp. GEM-RC1]
MDSIVDEQPTTSGGCSGPRQYHHELVSHLISRIHALKSNPTVSLATRQVFQSGHPYENNENTLGQCIIEGAAELEISFDPSCATEQGCDVLRFFSDSSRENCLTSASGSIGNSCWKDVLKVPGNSVFWSFKSDSSVVDWGYKFIVTPIMKKNFSPQGQFGLMLLDSLINIPIDEQNYQQMTKYYENPTILEALANLLVHNCTETADVLSRSLVEMTCKFFTNVLKISTFCPTLEIPVHTFSCVLDKFEDSFVSLLKQSSSTLLSSVYRLEPIVFCNAYIELSTNLKPLQFKNTRLRYLNDGFLSPGILFMLSEFFESKVLKNPMFLAKSVYTYNQKHFVMLESPHPYENSSSYCAKVEFPEDFDKIQIFIDPLTRTERNCDEVKISDRSNQLFNWSGDDFPSFGCG